MDVEYAAEIHDIVRAVRVPVDYVGWSAWNGDVYVSKSMLKGAGRGLFSRRFFAKGEIIGEYFGERLSEEAYKQRYGTGNSIYVIELPWMDLDSKKYIDPTGDEWEFSLMKYANDGKRRFSKRRGCTVRSKISGLTNGCFCTMQCNRTGLMTVKVLALREIPPAHEIFIDYSSGYWGSDSEGEGEGDDNDNNDEL